MDDNWIFFGDPCKTTLGNNSTFDSCLSLGQTHQPLPFHCTPAAQHVRRLTERQQGMPAVQMAKGEKERGCQTGGIVGPAAWVVTTLAGTSQAAPGQLGMIHEKGSAAAAHSGPRWRALRPKKTLAELLASASQGRGGIKSPGRQTQATTPLCAWRAGALRLRGARRVSAPMMLMIL